MDAILFLHRADFAQPWTRAYLDHLAALNPGAEIVPLHGTSDELVYQWFERANPKHDRFFLDSSYSWRAPSMRELYGDDYHKKFATFGRIIRPWSSDAFEGTHERYWPQFEDSDSAELYPYLRGIVPATVVMLSHDAIFNFNQLYKSIPAFKAMQPELRLGTLACMAGYL